jgi:peptide/nickel transport system substrate-binding protein
VKFHNGDALTAEDVKFSFERYKGGGAATLKARVPAVEIVDPLRVRFRMKQPWPDFMTFYATPATSAAWIVPKKYLERVGDDGFKKAPVGAGPYRFVSFNPAVGQARDPEIGAGRGDPHGDGQARRDGHRLRAARPRRR